MAASARAGYGPGPTTAVKFLQTPPAKVQVEDELQLAPESRRRSSPGVGSYAIMLEFDVGEAVVLSLVQVGAGGVVFTGGGGGGLGDAGVGNPATMTITITSTTLQTPPATRGSRRSTI
jgi:hypothetical protein